MALATVFDHIVVARVNWRSFSATTRGAPRGRPLRRRCAAPRSRDLPVQESGSARYYARPSALGPPPVDLRHRRGDAHRDASAAGLPRGRLEAADLRMRFLIATRAAGLAATRRHRTNVRVLLFDPRTATKHRSVPTDRFVRSRLRPFLYSVYALDGFADPSCDVASEIGRSSGSCAARRSLSPGEPGTSRCDRRRTAFPHAEANISAPRGSPREMEFGLVSLPGGLLFSFG